MTEASARSPRLALEHEARGSATPLEIVRATESRRLVPLESGRRLELRSAQDGAEQLTIHGTDGEVELRVTLTDDGPLLHFRSAGISLAASGRVSVECNEFLVRANKRIVQQTRGDFEQAAAGDMKLFTRKALTTSARSTSISSRRGDVKLKASDDVRLNGERVRLNGKDG